MTDILDLEFDSPDIGVTTVRNYLKQLLISLWTQAEGFSAKRPLGNSDWQWPIYTAMAESGLVASEKVYDQLEPVSIGEADGLIYEAIDVLFGKGEKRAAPCNCSYDKPHDKPLLGTHWVREQ